MVLQRNFAGKCSFKINMKNFIEYIILMLSIAYANTIGIVIEKILVYLNFKEETIMWVTLIIVPLLLIITAIVFAIIGIIFAIKHVHI